MPEKSPLTEQQLKIVTFVKTEGLKPKAAAPRLGVPASTIHAALTAARKAGMEVPRFTTQTSFMDGHQTDSRAGKSNFRSVDISIDVLRLIRPAAAKRGLSDVALARRIIEAVADGRLVDAVLDDAGEVAA